MATNLPNAGAPSPAVDVDKLVTSNLGRIIAFVLTPILLPLVGVGADWLQDILGIDMNPTEATGFIIAVITGVALMVWQWLRVHGRLQGVATELLVLRETGRQQIEQQAMLSPQPPQQPLVGVQSIDKGVVDALLNAQVPHYAEPEDLPVDEEDEDVVDPRDQAKLDKILPADESIMLPDVGDLQAHQDPEVKSA